MSDDSQLPSTRQILADDEAAARIRTGSERRAAVGTEDDDFRRVMNALRVVLQVGGSQGSGGPPKPPAAGL